MIVKRMQALGEKRSVIREIFEYGKLRKAQIGEENVFDFSLGNPSVPAPDCVTEALKALLSERDAVSLHGYTSAQGDAGVRGAIADYLNESYAVGCTANDLYMTVGAAASLSACLSAVAGEGEEVVAFAPFFPEYRVFTEQTGAKLSVVPCDEETFQISFDALLEVLNEKTAAVIINSPNNPSGAVLSAETLTRLGEILTEKSKEYGHTIYLIADEPYRELAYDGVAVPYPTHFYPDTLVCYSFSKSISLPGERIGYILVSPRAKEKAALYAAICGAGRSLGYVCAPSLFQHLIPKVLGKTADVAVYKRNRDLLYENLTSCGFTAVKPQGAFYLFLKSPESDAAAFCEKAKKYELLLVPGDDFAAPGYVRISYCVKTEQIERALPAFEKLAKEYSL